MTGIPSEAYSGAAGPQASMTPINQRRSFIDWVTGSPRGDVPPVVNEATALSYAAVYSCVSLIAGTIASLPLITYRRSANGRGKSRAIDSRVYGVLQTEFNPRTSAPVARETMTGHLLTWGNEYAQIVRNKSGSEVLELQPLGPDVVDVRIVERTREIAYDVYQRVTGDKIDTLPARDVIHVPALGFDGLCGYSPIRVASTTIRSGIAQDWQAERFVTRGVRPPGAIKLRDGVRLATDQQANEFRDRFRRIHSVAESDLNVLILEDGAGWEQLGIDPVDAQLLETRQYTRGEIAGLYRVPPHLIGDVDKSTSWGTGIEEQVSGFVKFTLLPWLTKKEKEFNRKLFGGASEVFCEHLLEGLERADITKRTAALVLQLQHGALSPNEFREIENRNPHPGGDVFFFPLSVGRVDAEGDDIPPPADPPKKPAAESPALADALRSAFSAAVARCLRKESEQVKRAAAKPQQFLAWIDDFYAKHAAMVADHTGPILAAWSAAFPGGEVADYPTRHIERSRAELLDAAGVVASDLPAAVERVCHQWASERPAATAAELQPTVVRRAV